jgi:putative ABC transport system substrate-binding protein
MRRRAFLSALAAAAACPLTVCAQTPPVPVVGFLRNTTAASSGQLVAAFVKGLREAGFSEGHNVAIEYRWADNHNERLPALAADLVKREVAVLVAGGGTAVAMAAKAATQTIPVVFELGGDPVKFGLVQSLNWPGGNVTGIALFANVVGPKRLQILHALVPRGKAVALLVNLTNVNAKIEIEQAHKTSRSLGIEIQVLHASTPQEIDAAFAALPRLNCQALVVSANPLFVGRREHLGHLPTRWPSRRFIPSAASPRRAACSAMVTVFRRRFVSWVFTRPEFSTARSPRTFRSCNRRGSSWSSI